MENNTSENSGTLLPSVFDAKKCSNTKLKKTNDRSTSYLLFNGSPMYCESPWLRAPFGASGFKPKNSDNMEWSINLSAASQDNLNEYELADLINNWFAQWKELDELMITYGIENSKAIFGKEYKPAQREVVKALYSPVVKVKDDYPERIQPKIPKKRDPSDKNKTIDSPNISVYFEGDETETTISTFEELEKLVPKNGYVKAIVNPQTWYIAGKFGLSLRVLQLLVKKRSGGKPVGYAFSTHGVKKETSSPAALVASMNLSAQPDSDDEAVEDGEGGEEVEEA